MTITPEKLRELSDSDSKNGSLEAEEFRRRAPLRLALLEAADEIERLRRAYPMQVLPLHPIPTDEEYQKAFEEAQRTPSFGKKP